MRYYIQYPDQTKETIDYDKQLVAETGMVTIYLKPAWKQIIDGLSLMGEQKFKERFCDPNEIVIFSEQGDEYHISNFADHIGKNYKFVKEDF